MAYKKSNKRNHLSKNRKKESTTTLNQNSAWPNLPNQLLALIARKPSLMKNITSFGCVIKSWKSSSSKNCTPNKNNHLRSLVEIVRANETSVHTIDIPFHDGCCHWYYKKRSYKEWYPGIYFKGHSHGHVVVFGDKFLNGYLWEPARRCAFYLPPWDTNLPFKLATLSSYPQDWIGFGQISLSGFPCFAMVITGISHPAFAFYRQKKGGKEWIFQDCNLKDPYNPSQNMRFCYAVGFRGKFYALSLQGSLVVLDQDVDSCFAITAVSKNRAVPSRPSRQFREYLMECDGEILIVFLISRKCIDVVDDVEVFKLDVFRLVWMKVENIEGRTLFLEDECCMWVRSSEVGCRSNCIYFTHHRVDDDVWFVYEMSYGGISSASGDFMRWDEPIIE